VEPARLIEITDPGDIRIAEFTSIRERDLTGRSGQFIAEGTVVLSMLARAMLAFRRCGRRSCWF
jgi:hypothetical protein